MKRFSKLLAFLLAFALIAGSLNTGAVSAYADETPMLISTRLAKGSRSHGFTLGYYDEDPDVNGNLQVWEHDKTGAKVYLLVNDDPERAFGIIFETVPSDDTGKLHILEHACCAASEKYPGRDVFFDLVSQGFFSDTNAQTREATTNYFISSLDEKELMNGADYYLDCAFHGAVRNDRKYFDREAFRYVISDENDPFDVTGVVYNEMKGVLSDIDSYTIKYAYKYLYPDSIYSYITGGVPEQILDLTYDELVDFYDEWYHPSNCSAVVYGDIDYNAWLEKFDAVFSQYDKKEFTAPDRFVPKGDYGTVTDAFPVYADTEDLSGRIMYVWDLPDTLTYSDYLTLGILAGYENEITSPIMQALNGSGIATAYELFTLSHADQRQFGVYAVSADTSRAEEFKTIIDEQFSAILKSTIDMETIDCIFETEAISEALTFNSSGVGFSFIAAITNAIEAQDVESMIYDGEVLDKAKKTFDDGKALKLFKNSVVNNDNKLLYVVTPQPGLAEEKEAAIAQKLADKKAAMSKKELKKVIADSLAYEEWNNTAGTDPETLAQLITVDPAALDIESPGFDTKITKKKGVTVATSTVDSDVSFYRYSFDISNLSKTKALYLNEYLNFLGLATTTRTQEQVSNDSRKYLKDFSAKIAMQEIDGKYVPSLVISFYAFDYNLENALDHIFDMFYNTDLDNAYNAAYIAQICSYYISSYSEPDSVFELLANAAGSYTSCELALSWNLEGIARYNMLNKAVSSEENFYRMLSGMKKARKRTVKRQNCVVRIVGSKDTRSASVNSMLARLPKKNKQYEAGTVVKLANTGAKNIAVEMNTQASYLYSIYQTKDSDPKNTAAMSLGLAIMSDAMYVPEFRYGLGAYTVYCGVTSEGIVYSMLYSSPEFAAPYMRTLETADELEALTGYLTDDMLEGYKLMLISELITPKGEWNMASTNLYYKVSGDGEDPRYAIAEALKNITVDDLRAAVPSIRNAYENMGTAIIGSKEEIEANKDMFDKIYKLK